jgi:tetratricopeptide (TPR) repeat protein
MYNLFRWGASITAIKKALKKGRLKQTGEAYTLLGISYYETGQLQSAQNAFTHALDYRNTKKSAQQWLKPSWRYNSPLPFNAEAFSRALIAFLYSRALVQTLASNSQFAEVCFTFLLSSSLLNNNAA